MLHQNQSLVAFFSNWGLFIKLSGWVGGGGDFPLYPYEIT